MLKLSLVITLGFAGITIGVDLPPSPNTTPEDLCIDLSLNCQAMQASCGDPGFFDIMSARCRKTCSFCKSPPRPLSDPHCTSQGDGVKTFNDANRAHILDVINIFRSKLAKGSFKMVNGEPAPSAINMFKLSYSCELEAQAQEVANSCESGGSLIPDAEFISTSFNTDISQTFNQINDAQMFWFFTLVNNSDGGVIFDESSAGGSGTWSKTREIGCGFNNYCSNTQSSYMVCAVYPRRPTWETPVYTMGLTCVDDIDCTEPGYNKCDSILGLCEASNGSFPTPTPAISNQCTEGNGITTMNSGNREYLLGRFNSYRSQVALGKFTMENGQKTPSGSNMIKLSYSCLLENYVQQVAANCATNGSVPNAQVLVHYEYVTTINQTFPAGSWWAFNLVKDSSNAVRVDSHSWVHGIWNTAAEIGCAFNPSCPGVGAVTYCAISPSMASWDSPLYTAGPSCTSNSQCTLPGFDKCEVATGLCYA